MSVFIRLAGSAFALMGAIGALKFSEHNHAAAFARAVVFILGGLAFVFAAALENWRADIQRAAAAIIEQRDAIKAMALDLIDANALIACAAQRATEIDEALS